VTGVGDHVSTSLAAPSRPSRETLARLARILHERLAGTHLERLWRPTATSLLIDFRALGRPRLFASLETRHPFAAVTTRWPDPPASPDRETLLLRKCLENARIASVTAEDDRRLVIALSPRHDHHPVLSIQLAGRYANAAVLDRPPGGAPEVELARLIVDRPAIDRDSPALPSGPVPHADHDDDAWLAAYAEALWQAHDARALDTRRAELLREARTAHERRRRTVKALEADLARAEQADALLHQGELLKSALHKVHPGLTEVEAVDWADPDQRTVTIPLDPTLSAADNLQRIFARYRKLERGQATILERLDAAQAAERELAELCVRIAAAESDDALAPLTSALRAAGVRPPAQPSARGPREVAERLPYRRFLATDGSEILVGRSARDNDALTFHVARGSDIFLHARDVSGSHVILRRRDRAEPSAEALIDAAALAAWGSKLRGETIIDVLWIERKHVKKPRGAAPGLVQTASPRTLTVRHDPARIARLYATLDPHERDA